MDFNFTNNRNESSQASVMRAFVDFLLLILVGVVGLIVILPLVRQQQEIETPKPVRSVTPKVKVNEVIALTEAGGFVFRRGSWQDDQLKARIEKQVVPQIVAMATNKGFNLFQVVGYTDGSPNRGGQGNFDQHYANYLAGKGEAPRPSTNMALSKYRAAFVARVIQAGLPFGLADKVQIKAVGAGPDQYIGDKPGVKEHEARRKIEIYALRIQR